MRFFDGDTIRDIGNAECQFRYRDSAFKDHKGWIVFRAELMLIRGDSNEVSATIP